jgi:hypothetical protein
VSTAPFSSPADRDVRAIGENSRENCLIALDENVLWCEVARPQGERILRMLRSGQLAISVLTFEPNSPQVLAGGRARLLPAGAISMSGLPAARRQPTDGFKTPHHVRATLKLGPRADAAEKSQSVDMLSTPPRRLAAEDSHLVETSSVRNGTHQGALSRT